MRLSPWLFDAARQDPGGTRWLTSCETCMTSSTIDMRKRIGCGYLPPAEGATPWKPAGYDEERNGQVTTCIGYTRQLPEVLEVGIARRHWDKGELRSWTGRAHPTPELVAAIGVFDAAMGDVIAHNRKDD